MDNESRSDQMTTSMEVAANSEPQEKLRYAKPGFLGVWLIAGSVAIIGIAALFIVRTLLSAPAPPIVEIEETPTPSPTPIRTVSAIATQGAFIALEQAYASLSASLTGTNLDDPSLSPPVLDLPLGFRQ
ncbi:hypothetical protein HY411_02565 [Candidatus Gottesmanbacteria bacterium]|nr:hypothetical protein [Candidatus Gottesmanbacteria bacterium]